MEKPAWREEGKHGSLTRQGRKRGVSLPLVGAKEVVRRLDSNVVAFLCRISAFHPWRRRMRGLIVVQRLEFERGCFYAVDAVGRLDLQCCRVAVRQMR